MMIKMVYQLFDAKSLSYVTIIKIYYLSIASTLLAANNIFNFKRNSRDLIFEVELIAFCIVLSDRQFVLS